MISYIQLVFPELHPPQPVPAPEVPEGPERGDRSVLLVGHQHRPGAWQGWPEEEGHLRGRQVAPDQAGHRQVQAGAEEVGLAGDYFFK